MKMVPKWPFGTTFARSRPDDWTNRTSVGRDAEHIPDIRRPALAGLDEADEVAPIAGDVEQRGVGIDVSLQVPHDLAPDGVLRADLAVVETDAVEILWPLRDESSGTVTAGRLPLRRRSRG